MNTTKDPWERDLALVKRFNDTFDPEEREALRAFLNYLDMGEWYRVRSEQKNGPTDNDLPF